MPEGIVFYPQIRYYDERYNWVSVVRSDSDLLCMSESERVASDENNLSGVMAVGRF